MLVALKYLSYFLIFVYCIIVFMLYIPCGEMLDPIYHFQLCMGVENELLIFCLQYKQGRQYIAHISVQYM